MGVVIQKQLNSSTSGVAFTTHPLTNSKSEVVIESLWGQGNFYCIILLLFLKSFLIGEGICSGEFTPDQFVVGWPSKQILRSKISTKLFQYSLAKNGIVKEPVPAEKCSAPSLTQRDLFLVLRLCKQIEKLHNGIPQDIEFAFEDNKLFFLQSRPITTLKNGTEILEWNPPGPGSWSRDYTHFPDPLCKITEVRLSWKRNICLTLISRTL